VNGNRHDKGIMMKKKVMIHVGVDSRQAHRMYLQTVLAAAAATTRLCCRESVFY